MNIALFRRFLTLLLHAFGVAGSCRRKHRDECPSPGLNPQDFLDYQFPLPSHETQVMLRKICAEMSALKRLQSETATELDALLPSILDRAFNGSI